MTVAIHVLAAFVLLPLVALLISIRYAVPISFLTICAYVTCRMTYAQIEANEDFDPGFVFLLTLDNVVYGYGVVIMTALLSPAVQKWKTRNNDRVPSDRHTGT